MPLIKSYLIDNIEASLQSDYEIKKDGGLPMDSKPRYLVLKTYLGSKFVYCCLSGGVLVEGEVKLTQVGKAALEALCNITSSSKEVILFQEVKLGPTPLKVKVKKYLKKVPNNSCICFFGDMTNELDGVLLDVFNLQGTVSV